MTDLARLRCFLLDMDGTVCLGPEAIPGAAAFVQYLRVSGRSFLLFTNNPSSDAAHYAARLSSMGIDVGPDHILTAGEATVRFLSNETDYRRLYVLGTPAFEAELTRAGFVLTEKDPDAVVLAFDKTLTYAKLERACLLLRDGLPYVATNPDRVCPTELGYIPDCGAIAALIEAATAIGGAPGRQPRYIGKPNAEMARMGMAKAGAVPEESAMVGDRLYTDMAMAKRYGITSILVLSGETGANDADSAGAKPDYVFPSIADLHTALLRVDGDNS